MRGVKKPAAAEATSTEQNASSGSHSADLAPPPSFSTACRETNSSSAAPTFLTAVTGCVNTAAPAAAPRTDGSRSLSGDPAANAVPKGETVPCSGTPAAKNAISPAPVRRRIRFTCACRRETACFSVFCVFTVTAMGSRPFLG